MKIEINGNVYSRPGCLQCWDEFVRDLDSALSGLRRERDEMQAEIARMLPVVAASVALLDGIYPSDLVTGCEGCATKSCECAVATQLVRTLRDSIVALGGSK